MGIAFAWLASLGRGSIVACGDASDISGLYLAAETGRKPARVVRM